MVMNPPSGQMMKPPSFKAPSRELSEASRSLSLTAGARSSSLLLSRPHDTTTSPYQPPSRPSPPPPTLTHAARFVAGNLTA
jgi:hypothetical protein